MITDVSDFFQTNDFAEPAFFYTASGQNPSSITVIFTDQYALSVIGSVAFQNKDITVHCRSIDVANATPASIIVVRGETLYVDTIQPDGTGITVLSLCTTSSRST